jgi:hypothetical protein
MIVSYEHREAEITHSGLAAGWNASQVCLSQMGMARSDDNSIVFSVEGTSPWSSRPGRRQTERRLMDSHSQTDGELALVLHSGRICDSERLDELVLEER